MMQANRIQISGTIELNDFMQAFLWFQFKRRIVSQVIYWVLIIGGAVLLYDTVANAPGSQADSILPFLLGLLAIPILFIALQVGLVYLNARRQFTSSKLAQMRTEYTLSDAGIEAVNSDSSSKTHWGGFYEVHETDDSFLLFQNRAIMQILPKRLFDDPAKVAAFRDLLRKHLGEKAKLRTGK